MSRHTPPPTIADDEALETAIFVLLDELDELLASDEAIYRAAYGLAAAKGELLSALASAKAVREAHAAPPAPGWAWWKPRLTLAGGR